MSSTNLTFEHIINGSLTGGNGLQRQNTVFMGYLYLIVTLSSYISNAFFLFIYFRTSNLKTPFSVYIVSLSICDLCKSLTNGVMKTTNNLQMRWFLGDGYCLVTLYCAQTITATITYVQVLISLNRFWAVTFPNNYRMYHNKKLALCKVVAVVLWVNLWYLPEFLTDVLGHRTPDQVAYCLMPFGSKKSVYFYFFGTVIHLVPQAIVVGIYPVIYYKVKVVLRNRAQIGLARPATPKNNNHTSKPKEPEVSPSHSINKQDSSSSKPSTSLPLVETKHFNVQAKRDQEKDTYYQPKNHQRARPEKATGTRHFAVLTTLLISATVLWTPTHLAYILMMSGTFVDFRFLGVANFLFALDCTMNPILCVLASKDWREAIRVLFRRR